MVELAVFGTAAQSRSDGVGCVQSGSSEPKRLSPIGCVRSGSSKPNGAVGCVGSGSSEPKWWSQLCSERQLEAVVVELSWLCLEGQLEDEVVESSRVGSVRSGSSKPNGGVELVVFGRAARS